MMANVEQTQETDIVTLVDMAREDVADNNVIS